MKVKFLTTGQYATSHADEPPFSHEAGEVVDLSRVTRSPSWLATRLVQLNRAEFFEEQVVEEIKPAELEIETTNASREDVEMKPMKRKRKERGQSLLD